LGVRVKLSRLARLGVRFNDSADVKRAKREEEERVGKDGTGILRGFKYNGFCLGCGHAWGRKGREEAIRVWDFLQRRLDDILRVAVVGDATDHRGERRVEFVLADERGDYREWVFMGRVRVCVERLVFSQSEYVRRRVGGCAIGVLSDVW